MTGLSCPREADSIRAVRTGILSEDSRLASHVAACASCRAAVAIAAAFRADREAALLKARLPSPGLVWWKAELRARREQVRVASRPVLVAHGVALGSVLAATLAAVSWLAPRADALVAGLGIWPQVANLGAWPRIPVRLLALPNLEMAALAQPGILLVAAAAVVLAPLALYLALSRE